MKNGFHKLMKEIPIPDQEIIKVTTKNVKINLQNKRKHATWYEFVFVQCLFLKSKLWILQVVGMMVAGYFAYLCTVYKVTSLLHFIIGFLPIFIHMLSIPILLRSIDNEVVEIENVTYYRYHQVLITRIFLIGFLNLFLIGVFIFFSYGLVEYTLQQIFLYSLVPFNITCAISLLIMYYGQHQQTIYYCITSNILFSVILFLLTNTRMYIEITSLYIWKFSFIVSLLFLLGITYRIFQQALHCDIRLYERRIKA